jgi:HPt (histidine-containing phosphotransfer) domain-containing protein
VTPEQAQAIARYQDAEHRIAVALRTASAERIVEIAQRMEAIADEVETRSVTVGDRMRLMRAEVVTVLHSAPDGIIVQQGDGTLTIVKPYEVSR